MDPIHWISILEIHDQNNKIPIQGPQTPTLKKPSPPTYVGEKGAGAQAKATSTNREPDDPRYEIINS